MISIIKWGREEEKACMTNGDKWSAFEPWFRWIQSVHFIHPSTILKDWRQASSLFWSSRRSRTAQCCNKFKTIIMSKPLQSWKLPLFCRTTLPRQCFSLILSFLKAAQFLPFEGYGLQFVSYYYCLWLIKFWSVSQPRQLRAVIITCRMV